MSTVDRWRDDAPAPPPPPPIGNTAIEAFADAWHKSDMHLRAVYASGRNVPEILAALDRDRTLRGLQRAALAAWGDLPKSVKATILPPEIWEMGGTR